MYAEDDKRLRGMVVELISEELPGVNLEVFSSGDSLDKKLSQGSNGFNLVLTDDNMPCIYGREIIAKYARKSGFENVPFILFYGGPTEIGKQAVRDGAFAFLEKPARNEELVGLVKKALKIE